MPTTAKTHLPSPDIRFRQVFDGYRVNKGDMYYFLYPAGQVMYVPSAPETFTVSNIYDATTVWVPIPALPISRGSVVRTSKGPAMLTLTHPSLKDLVWGGDNGRTWSDLYVQEHFLEVIYDSGNIDNTEVIYDQGAWEDPIPGVHGRSLTHTAYSDKVET